MYNIKEFQDLCFLYLAFSYIDSELRENDLVVSVNGVNELSAKAKQDAEFNLIKDIFNMVKLLNIVLNNHGIKPNTEKGDDLVKVVLKIIDEVFKNKNNDIVGAYLGFLILLKYSDYKFKKIKVLFDEKIVIDYIDYINDNYWAKDSKLKPVIDNSENIVDDLFKLIYTTSFIKKEIKNLKD